MNLGEYQKRLHTQGDSYMQMVVALRALANEMLFDDATRQIISSGVVRCGRRMTTSAANRYSKNTNVTPDLVVQPSPTYGLLTECKWGVPRDLGLFAKVVQETVEQLEKYDDELIGWPIPSGTRPLATHDLVILVNHEDSKRLAKELALRRDANTFRLVRNFAVVGIAQMKRAEGIWPELELEEGRLSDAEKTQKLSNRVPINPAKLSLNPQVALVELCDTAPPTPLMMELIHKAAIQNLSREQHDQNRLDGRVNQGVALGELCDWVKRFAFTQSDARDRVCPEEGWIRAAMTTFVAMKWAEKPEPKKDVWVFLHKRGRRSPYARFIRFCAKRDMSKLRSEEKSRARMDQRLQEQRMLKAAKEEARKKREEEKNARQLAREIEKAPLFADEIKKGRTEAC